MKYTQPIADTTVRDDFTMSKISGGPGNDHLIHHRDLNVEEHVSVGLVGFAGDDILEGSVPRNGQIHMFGAKGDDWFVLDVTKIPDAVGVQGHHAYGGHGRDTFQFKNIYENVAPIIGRLDDFDPTSDRVLIENMEIDLADLPKSIKRPNGDHVDLRVIEVEHPEFIAEDLGVQNFLAIEENAFYALDGTRDLKNGPSDLVGEERHFLKSSALETLRSTETVQYQNPKNFVPRDFYEHREDDLTVNWNQYGTDVTAETGEKSAAHMFGSKGNLEAQSSSGEQTMRGSSGDDVIDANNANDTVFGGIGNDLIAGGIDNDMMHGNRGDDMIWGGDGEDSLEGGSGDDYLHGGRGDDVLSGGSGHDTLFGGAGNDTLIGGGGEDAVNRFHFYEEGGADVILDFKVGLDRITLQDDIDPLTVELYENEHGSTVLNYGEEGSVELRGVALKAFQTAAESRAEEDNPIINISSDPEEEMLQELRVEQGYYGDAVPPTLMVAGIEYGGTAFQSTEPGGYAYVSATDVDRGSDQTGAQDETYVPTFSMLKRERETAEVDEENDDKEQDVDVGTCFVATAAYRDRGHPDVVFLRAFRDQWLVHRAWGRAFIAFYWHVGPRMAIPVRRTPRLARICKTLISGIVRILRRLWNSPPATKSFTFM